MESLIPYLPLLARCFIGGAFIVAGINNIIYREYKIKTMTVRGVPSPKEVFWLGIILQTIGGLAVIFDVWLLQGVWILVVFTIVASYMFHDFWNSKDEAFRMKIQGFFTNFNVLGGLILLGYFLGS